MLRSRIALDSACRGLAGVAAGGVPDEPEDPLVAGRAGRRTRAWQRSGEERGGGFAGARRWRRRERWWNYCASGSGCRCGRRGQRRAG